MNVYPINTAGQHIYVAHNSEEATAYTDCLTTGGYNFSLTYENYIHRGVKQETWLIVREQT